MKNSLILRTAWLAVIFTAVTSFTYAQSQASINIKADASLAKADRELTVTYQKILKNYASQPIFIKKFKVAQRLWVQLRDAELDARYPDTGTNNGSAEPMCKSIYLEKLTKERIKFLSVWLTGIPEGDVCTGSVKMIP